MKGRIIKREPFPNCPLSPWQPHCFLPLSTLWLTPVCRLLLSALAKWTTAHQMYRFDYPPFCWPLCFLTSRGCKLNSIKKNKSSPQILCLHSLPYPPPPKKKLTNNLCNSCHQFKHSGNSCHQCIYLFRNERQQPQFLISHGETSETSLLLRAKSDLGFVPLTVNMTPNYFQRKKDPINYITDWGSLILCLLPVFTKATWNLSNKYPVYLNIKILHNVIYIVWVTNGISSI